eukprot:4432578-Prymnesium_polylepis.1
MAGPVGHFAVSACTAQACEERKSYAFLSQPLVCGLLCDFIAHVFVNSRARSESVWRPLQSAAVCFNVMSSHGKRK